jgi:hypothetical protein
MRGKNTNKITIEIPVSDLEYLLHTSMSAEIRGWNEGHNKDRFQALEEGARTVKIPPSGTLHWCNTILELRVAKALIEAKGVKTRALYDTGGGGCYAYFCLWTSEPWEAK